MGTYIFVGDQPRILWPFLPHPFIIIQLELKMFTSRPYRVSQVKITRYGLLVRTSPDPEPKTIEVTKI